MTVRAPYNLNKRWTLSDMRHAYGIYHSHEYNDVEKAQHFKDLGRSTSAVIAMCQAVRSAANGRTTACSYLNQYELEYVMNRRDTPGRPKPVVDEIHVSPPDGPDVTETASLDETHGTIAEGALKFREDVLTILVEVASALVDISRKQDAVIERLEAHTLYLASLERHAAHPSTPIFRTNA